MDFAPRNQIFRTANGIKGLANSDRQLAAKITASFVVVLAGLLLTLAVIA